jgi:hypothetical protein
MAMGIMAGVALGKSPLPVAGEMVTLPIVLPDEQGIRWDLQNDGSIADGGNDLYDGGGHLYLDGGFQFITGGLANFNREHNEVVLGPVAYHEMNVSRRVAVNARLGFCRWAEVFENPTTQKISTQLRVHFDMGGEFILFSRISTRSATSRRSGWRSAINGIASAWRARGMAAGWCPALSRSRVAISSTCITSWRFRPSRRR